MNQSIIEYHRSDTEKSRIMAKAEEIQLVRMQIDVMTERYDQCANPEKMEKYKKALSDLEDKLESLLMPQLELKIV